MARPTEGLPFGPEALWIGSEHPFDLHEAYLCFRSPAAWYLASKPQQASLYLTADSRYKLWVNGQFVARGPARSYPTAQAVDCLDVTPYLQAGSNLLAVQVYQPGYSHFAYIHRAAAGLLACLVCDEAAMLATTPAWRVRRDPSFAANVPRVSIYGSGVEERDLNLADDWWQPDYDDDNWASARVVATVGHAPWTGLQQRELPFLTERALMPTLLETRRSNGVELGRLGPVQEWTGDRDNPTSTPSQPPSKRGEKQTLPPSRGDQGGESGSQAELLVPDPHLTLRAGWSTAVPQPLTPDEAGWFKLRLTAGEAAYWLFDLGQDYTCQGWAEIEGAGGQEQLAISYQEKIRDGVLIISDPQTYCRVRLTDRFRLRPGGQVAEGFTLRGGRYVLWQVIGPTGPDFRVRFRVRVAEYPLAVTRSLSTTDTDLAAIIAMCERTARVCLQDGFVDCVWRESSQWLGDALPQSLILAAMSDDYRPLRQVLLMAAQGAYPDGVLPSVLPGEVHAYTVVDYNFTWVELLHLYWTLTGDELLVAELWPPLDKMLDRFHDDVSESGLLMSQPGRRLFLDWSPLSRSEPSAVYNLRYLLTLQIAAQLADDRGLRSDNARLWRERAKALQTAIQAAFWHNERWYDDLEQTTFSQQAAVLALLTDSTSPEAIEPQLDLIIARSLDLADEPISDKMVLASPFMHHYIFEALRQHQRYDEVIEIVRRRWGRWVKAGYPTTWENWDVDFPDGSQCHAFSAHPRYHLAEIAKVRGYL